MFVCEKGGSRSAECRVQIAECLCARGSVRSRDAVTRCCLPRLFLHFEVVTRAVTAAVTTRKKLGAEMLKAVMGDQNVCVRGGGGRKAWQVVAKRGKGLFTGGFSFLKAWHEAWQEATMRGTRGKDAGGGH